MCARQNNTKVPAHRGLVLESMLQQHTKCTQGKRKTPHAYCWAWQKNKESATQRINSICHECIKTTRLLLAVAKYKESRTQQINIAGTKHPPCTGGVPHRTTDGPGNQTRKRLGPHMQTTAAHAAKDQRRRDPPGTTPTRGPERVRRGASPAPPPRQGPAPGTKCPVLGRPQRAPRSRPVKPGTQAPWVGKGTTATGKLTRAPRATRPDEARRTMRGHEARQRGTPPSRTKAHRQVPSSDDRRVPQTRRARKTRNQPRHTNRCQATANPNTANPSQEWRGAVKTRARAHTPTTHTPARRGGAQPKPEPKHTHPHRAPVPGVAGCKRSAHTSTHTAPHPSQEWRGAAERRAQTHTPTPRSPARSGRVQAERAHEHTQSPTAQPGVAGRSQNPGPSTHTQAAHPSQERRGTGGAGTQAHTHPNTPARSGGAQPKAEPKYTHPHRTPQPGVAECKRSTHAGTHTAQDPRQEWWGAAETRAQTHTPTAHTPARSSGVQAERPHQLTHSPTPQPGVAGCSRNPSPNTHIHGAHPSQEWRGAGGALTPAHTQPNTPARSGGAQPKPKPKHTHPRRAPQPAVAGCKRTAHTSTHTPKHPSQEWRGAAETRAQTHTHTPRSRARSGWVQAERAHEHTHSPTPHPGVAGRSRNPSPNTHIHTAHPCPEWQGASGARTRARTQPNTPARSGGAQPKPESKHTHPHRAPVPGVAGCKRSAHTSTHTTKHPSQEWRGAAETRAEAHTPTPHTPARSGGVQAEHAHEHTHSLTPQRGVAGRNRNPSRNTHTHTAHPSQEWRGASGARTRAHTQPNIPARGGGAQPKPEPEHTHRQRTPQPGVAARSQNPNPNTHNRTAHPCKEWLGARGARTQAHRLPNTPARGGGAQPKPEPKHTHPRRTTQPGVAGCKQIAHTSRNKPRHPSQEWRGAAGTKTQPYTPTPHTPAKSGRVQTGRTHKRTHSPTPQPGVAGRSRNPNPTTTQTQTQVPRNSRKPSVHSPGTEAASAMQVTRPDEIRRPGVRLHPKACAALGLEAERATPKHLGTPVPRTCMHALGTGYARKSVEPLGFRPKEGTCASTGAHPPGMTSSHAGGDQPSQCCPGPLCWAPPVRSSGR